MNGDSRERSAELKEKKDASREDLVNPELLIQYEKIIDQNEGYPSQRERAIALQNVIDQIRLRGSGGPDSVAELYQDRSEQEVRFLINLLEIKLREIGRSLPKEERDELGIQDTNEFLFGKAPESKN